MRIKTFLKTIIFFMLLGAFVAFMFHGGFIAKLGNVFSATKIYWYFILIPITLFVLVLIHELGHLFAFLVQGIKIRALYVFIFKLFKNQKGWHFRVSLKQIVFLGGVVVPNLDNINSEEEYQLVVKKFAKALIAAPIVTIILGILIPVTAIVLFFLISNYVLIGILFIASIITILFTFVAYKSFSIEVKQVHGDFIAYKKMKQDEIFQIIMLLQYMQMSLVEVDKSFLYDKAKAVLLDNMKKTSHVFYPRLLTLYLEMVTQDLNRFDETIHQTIKNKGFYFGLSDDVNLLMSHKAIHYFYALGDVKKSYDIYNKISTFNSPLNKNLLNLTKNIVHISYDSTFVEETPNTKDFSWLLKDIINDNEEEINLPFMEYKSDCSYIYEEENSESDQD